MLITWSVKGSCVFSGEMGAKHVNLATKLEVHGNAPPRFGSSVKRRKPKFLNFPASH